MVSGAQRPLCGRQNTNSVLDLRNTPASQKRELPEMGSLFGPRGDDSTEPGRECWRGSKRRKLLETSLSYKNVFQAKKQKKARFSGISYKVNVQKQQKRVLSSSALFRPV